MLDNLFQLSYKYDFSRRPSPTGLSLTPKSHLSEKSEKILPNSSSSEFPYGTSEKLMLDNLCQLSYKYDFSLRPSPTGLSLTPKSHLSEKSEKILPNSNSSEVPMEW